MNTSLTGYRCDCYRGYEGDQCERMINFCANVTCLNRGVCSREFLNYTCNCLAGSYGRHCEITETGSVVRTYVRKSNLKKKQILFNPFLFNVFLFLFLKRFWLYSDNHDGISGRFYCRYGRVKIWFWY